MKVVLLSFLLVISFSFSTWAQQANDPLGQNGQNGGPDLNPQNSPWANVNAPEQIIAAVADLLIIAKAETYRDPIFKDVTRRYDIAKKQKDKAETSFNDKDGKLKERETQLKGLKEQREASEAELQSTDKLITLKQDRLDDSRSLLTSAEKESETEKINEKINQYFTQTLKGHRGKLNTLDDMAKSLPSSDRADYERLISRKNKLHEMPNVTGEERDHIIKSAETDLKATIKQKDSLLDSISKIQTQMAKETQEIERIAPQVSSAKVMFDEETGRTAIVENELNALKVEHHFRITRLNVLKWGARSYVATDILGRVVIIYFQQQDPGFSPWIHFIRTATGH